MMTEDKIRNYAAEWIRLLTNMGVSKPNAPITLYEYIKLREGTLN